MVQRSAYGKEEEIYNNCLIRLIYSSTFYTYIYTHIQIYIYDIYNECIQYTYTIYTMSVYICLYIYIYTYMYCCQSIINSSVDE